MKLFLKKCLFTISLALCIPLCGAQGTECNAQSFGNTPPLHVDGKWLKDPQGNKVVLHGVMDTPSPYFNNYRWGWSCDDNNTTNCINYFNKLFTAITDTKNGAYCNVFRLHLDPCWTNDNNVKYCDKTGDGEANIEHFSKTKLQKYMKSLYWKIIEKALKHGLYVVVRPPGVCPGTIQVGDVYNNYLMEVWDIVSQNDSIRKYSGQVSIELANEPVTLLNANGQDTQNALHDFFQPIVNKIRANGFTGIIWAPGTGWQGNYRNYATNPITGYNIGYAVHDYVGWYNTSDTNYGVSNAINSFKNSVPVVETAPIIITEVDWSPEKAGTGHYNEHGDWVVGNYGTWATGSTSKWGKTYKAVLDNFENISMTLSGTACYIDIDKSIATTPAKPVIAFDGNEECCGKACFDWYKEYAIGPKAKIPYADYKRKWSADLGTKYKNPIINADFPDPDVIRVGDTFYMVSTTMFYFPGATILKSKDLVNWEYCANPLKQIANNNAYNLEGANHYSQGQWAASLNYSGGKFYLYFICYGRENVDNTMNIMLTTTNPEGEWEMKYMNDHYYDSGWLFDDKANGGDGNIYVACGIGDIYVNKLNRSLQKISSTKVLSLGNGLEGCHMYHIGDYYYIYATYGGTEGSQTIFRSTDPMGPYEEHQGRVFANQHIHQGALVDTPTGEWWTILFKDAGAIGRVPYLEPVKWENGWPIIGNNGIDVTKNSAAYKKPTVTEPENLTNREDLQRKYLPTNDTFSNPSLGLQWEWNHNEVSTGWSLFDNPGNLRLYTVSVTDSLIRARGSLTQRIFGYNPEGTSSTKYYNSYGTIKMDISHMQEGDVAGISVFQDPYSQIGIRVKDGKKYLYSALVYAFDGKENGTEIWGDEITQDVIYLRAVANFGTNKAKYYYSLDNKTWKKFGVEMNMRFILTIFTGNRFFIYNYGTKRLGGYVDIDWFSTEPEYEESMFYDAKDLVGYTTDDLTISTLTMKKNKIVMNTSSSYTLEITCKAKSGMESNVAANCEYQIENNDLIDIIGGRVITKGEGTTNVTATYTDHFGTAQSVSFTVTASTFPLSSDCFNPSIYGTGTFTELTTILKTSQYGFGGWVYSNGIDLSDYKYIVVKLKRTSTCNPSFRIFDKNDYWSDPHIHNMGKLLKNVIDLNDMKSESGRKLDPSHIYIAGFWTDGSDQLYIKEVFLSNDGTNPASGIESILYQDEDDNDEPETITNIQGMRISAPQKGVNIIRMPDGTTKKILVR